MDKGKSAKPTWDLPLGVFLLAALTLGLVIPASTVSAGDQHGSFATPATSNIPQQGIKVHGHWTIEVRDPDGSLVSHREFENALVNPDGGRALIRFLTSARSMGTWMIGLYGTSGNGPCLRNDGVAVECRIVDSSDPWSGTHYFHNLTFSVPSSPDPNAGNLVLSGTATAGRDGDVNRVYTFLRSCPASVGPSACQGAALDGVEGFTNTSLSPIPVVAGQLIRVTVIISFS